MQAVFDDASNGRAVAARAVRAHASILDETRCNESPSRIAARFNLLHEAGIADDCEIFDVGAGIRRENTSTGCAHPFGAQCSVLDRDEGAPLCGIACVISALVFVVTLDRREVTTPVHVVAVVIGACVLVVAHDPFAAVLPALARYTNASKAIVGAFRSVLRRPKLTLTKTTILFGAFVAVVRANNTFTRVVVPVPVPQVPTTSRHRNYAQPADKQKSEYITHKLPTLLRRNAPLSGVT